MNDFPINKIGKITQGQYKDWYVLVKPFKNSMRNAYMVFVCNHISFGKDKNAENIIGYDSYAEDSDAVIGIIEDWDVNWDIDAKDIPSEWLEQL